MTPPGLDYAAILYSFPFFLVLSTDLLGRLLTLGSRGLLLLLRRGLLGGCLGLGRGPQSLHLI